MKEFFNRKKFDPVNNEADKSALNVLRQHGRRRVCSKYRHLHSTALNWAFLETTTRSGRFLDLGCGDSPDSLIAAELGFEAFGLDLFPPTTKNIDFIEADAVEHIPLFDNSVDIAISQAMLDLIEPVAREQFFREVDRVLKHGSVFACYIQWLQSGWGFDLQEEQERASKVWKNIRPKTQGFVVIKGEQK